MIPPPKEITPGSRVTLHLSLTLADGTEALSTFGDEPIQFTLGDGTLPEGLELALYGLEPGDDQTLELTPDQAFGYADEDLVHPVPRQDFPPEIEPQPGQIIHFTGPQGEELAGTVVEREDHQILVDFNHPLAGQTLRFRALVLEID